MSDEMGRELGNRLGRYIESNKRSWLSEQAKFMRIRVDLPINKPLRRGGNIVNMEGEKFWVMFKYERLPNFCFCCGFLGHDEKHCLESQQSPNTTKQYGVWLQANDSPKLSGEKPKASSSYGFDERKKDGSEDKQALAQAAFNSTNIKVEQVGFLTTLRSHTHPNNMMQGMTDTSTHHTTENQMKGKKVSSLNPVPQPRKHSFEFQKSLETRKEIGDESSTVGLLKQPLPEAQEVTSPLKPPKGAPHTSETSYTPRGPGKENWKKYCQSPRATSPKS